MAYIGERVPTALLLNELAANLSNAGRRYPLILSGVPDKASEGQVLVVGLHLEPNETLYPNYIHLIAFLTNPHLVSATYPVNSTVLGGAYPYSTYPPSRNLELSSTTALSSTQLSSLENGDFALNYTIPKDSLSLGSWELFVFVTNSAEGTYLASVSASFQVNSASTPSPYVTYVVGLSDSIGLAGLFTGVFSGSRYLWTKLTEIPPDRRRWIRENVWLVFTVVAAAIFLLLRYVILPLL
jgi:hypothetical protein